MLWVSDADNTLWDTDSVYRHAQLVLLSAVESAVGVNVDAEDRLAYLREIDQKLAKSDHRGLKYPPTMLVLAVALRLRGLALPKAVEGGLHGCAEFDAGIIRRIVEDFRSNLATHPELRAGVSDGLKLLNDIGVPIVVLTEGPKERIEQTARGHKLDDYIDIVISAEKTESLFARVAKMRSKSARWAIGDQLEKDVLPAIAAGYRGIYFPGGFRPSWAPQAGPIDGRFEIVSSYVEAVQLAIRASSAVRSVSTNRRRNVTRRTRSS